MSVLSHNMFRRNFGGKGKENHFVEKSNLTAAEFPEFKNNQNRILILLSGNIRLIFDLERIVDLRCGQMLFLEHNQNIQISVQNNASLISLVIPDKMEFSENIPIESLMYKLRTYESQDKAKGGVLSIRSGINYYIESLFDYLIEKLKSDSYYELKMKELRFLLEKFYSSDELVVFFHSSLIGYIEFYDDVKKYIQTCIGADEIAARMNCSVPDFSKRFRKIFGETPSHWLRHRRLRIITYELLMTGKTVEQIMSEQGFTSMAGFNNFCKTNFKRKPEVLRKNNSYYDCVFDKQF